MKSNANNARLLFALNKSNVCEKLLNRKPGRVPLFKDLLTLLFDGVHQSWRLSLILEDICALIHLAGFLFRHGFPLAVSALRGLYRVGWHVIGVHLFPRLVGSRRLVTVRVHRKVVIPTIDIRQCSLHLLLCGSRSVYWILLFFIVSPFCLNRLVRENGLWCLWSAEPFLSC